MIYMVFEITFIPFQDLVCTEILENVESPQISAVESL